MTVNKRFLVAKHFSAELKIIARTAKLRFGSCVDVLQDETLRSIQFGSGITNAPGQPVKTERLRKSWRAVRKNQWAFDVMSDTPYAEIIETNARGAILRSPVGGFHSVAITVGNYGLLAKHALLVSKQLHPDQ